MANGDEQDPQKKIEMGLAAQEFIKKKKEEAAAYVEAAKEGRLLNEVYEQQLESISKLTGASTENIDQYGKGAMALAAYKLQATALAASMGSLGSAFQAVLTRQQDSASEFNKLTGINDFFKLISDGLISI